MKIAMGDSEMESSTMTEFAKGDRINPSAHSQKEMSRGVEKVVVANKREEPLKELILDN